MTAISLGREELEIYANKELAFYGLDLCRISSVFIMQVMQLNLARTFNTFKILDEVKYLEGISKTTATPKHTKFNRPPLKGLYKKHFTDAAFLVKNLTSHFGCDFGGNDKLDKVVNDAFEENGSGYVDESLVKKLSHDLVISAIQERASKGLTGEWIIFQKHNEKYYYLTLGAHSEDDTEIFKRVIMAYEMNFPFLAEP